MIAPRKTGSGSSRRRRVAIIGGGPAGIVTLKELKEKGLDVTLFEKRTVIGGAFTNTYEGLQLTSSSAITSFGSFLGGDPARPVLWRSDEYLEYLNAYAERFALMRNIRLGTSVESARRLPNGRWRLRVAAAARGRGVNGELEFDHLVICTGTNRRPQLPAWARPDRFAGRIVHSGEVRNAAEFSGKRVLVVGMGESGSDLALMAAQVAEASAISTRLGPGYVIPRRYRGLPADVDTNRCYHAIPRTIIGKPIVRFKVRIEEALEDGAADRAVLRKVGELNRARGLSPFHRFGTKSTAFIEAMVHHGAAYYPEVKELRADRVVFVDGREFECDTIVCCTGFAPEFAFLDEHEAELAQWGRNARSMYKHMIAPEVRLSVAWVGFVRPGIGSVQPCAEMQARYLAQLITGERALPTRTAMQQDIQLHADVDLQQFPADAGRLKVLTDYFRFMETMADAIGCRPPVLRLLATDPRTGLKVLFGPLTGAQYRLTGPGADADRARAAIRQFPTMPWLVLAYELLMMLGSWAMGATREPWRKRSPVETSEQQPLPSRSFERQLTRMPSQAH